MNGSDEVRRGERSLGGLCPQCVHVREIVSERGSVFWMCKLAAADPRLPRYPPQPRHVCAGFERRQAPRGE